MPSADRTILVCDDDLDICRVLKIQLEKENYHVLECHNGYDAIQTVKDNKVDLVILDVMMPGMDGIVALQKIREISNIPVIFLTAKSEDHDQVMGLQSGADAYITKPFNNKIVSAHIKAQLRRYQLLGAQEDEGNIFRSGNLMIVEEENRCYIDDEEIPLTQIEYKILRYLLKNKGKVIPAKEIYEKVWQQPCYGSEGAVTVHIRHIRQKIEPDSSHPVYLKVVWGRGYQIIDLGD